MSCRILGAVLPLALLSTTSVLAAESYAGKTDEEIIVTATRTPTPLPQVGSAVSVITPLEIERQKPQFLVDLLPQLPGVTFTQFGPPGTASDIRIRGADAFGTLVLIDGVEVSDPSLIQTSFQFSHLLTGDLERVEVLRGSQSTLYGADAIGGVINITTRAGGGPLRHSARLEGGSFGTVMGSYGLSGGEGPVGYAFQVQGYRSDGFSAADENDGNTEKDGYENLSFTGKLSAAVSDNLLVSANLRYADTRVQFDGGFPLADADNEDDQNQLSARSAAELELMDGRWSNLAAVTYTRTTREGTSAGMPSSDFTGERLKFEYRGAIEVDDDQTLLFGAETENEESKSLEQPGGVEARTSGYYIQYQLGLFDRLYLTAGARIDDHENFGTHDTYRIAASFLLPETDTRFRASYGTGFRAPSLFELFGECCGLPVPLGNQDVEPETSRSFDVGIEQDLLNEALRLELTYFRLETDNKIVFDFSNFGIGPAYVNFPGESVSKGVEVVASWVVGEDLELWGSYTYLDAKDPDGFRLPLRPKNSFTLVADLDVLDDRGHINVNLRRVADVEQFGVPLDNYTLVGAVVSYDLTDEIELYGRVQNLLDKEFQTRPGYGTADLSGFLGLRAKF
ncbi:MAG: TonB-dependent receptor [Alphaproteobacteria bacterium]|nr:MAG: TonB-dependent receptor [Alphaproteobacteria bacterium]